MQRDKLISIQWQDGKLILIDQTQLPGTVCYEEQKTLQQVWDSIRILKVRGAPAIGVAAAYGLVVGMKEFRNLKRDNFLIKMREQSAFLNSSRPTAVNLSWALSRMAAKLEQSSEQTGEELYSLLIDEAEAIHKEDIELCENIGINGKSLIKEGMGILTHCNAGALATSAWGTATAPLYKSHIEGKKFKVYADETRPLLQGSRLTALELHQAGIDVTVICDNMAATLMSQGEIDMVIVGTDRVALNGDVANKIGTLGTAILARHFDIPFYVACPASTIDINTPTGHDIPIEERPREEVISFGKRITAPEDIKVRNPAFDVTPAALVSGIITEKGIIRHPLSEGILDFYGNSNGN